MIDVLHPGNTELSQRFAHFGSERTAHLKKNPDDPSIEGGTAYDEESAWLQSIRAAAEDMTTVKGLKSGILVMDVGQLRVDPLVSTPRRPAKGKLPA